MWSLSGRFVISNPGPGCVESGMGPKRKEKESDTQSQKNGEQNCRPDPIDDLFYQAFESIVFSIFGPTSAD